MTALDDPLLAHLDGELAQIEAAVGLRRRLAVPLVLLAEGLDGVRTFSWSFRFTWQEVERSRRYVIPLPRERAVEAQRGVAAEIGELVWSRLEAEPRVARLTGGEAELRARLESQAAGAPLQTWRLGGGRMVGFVDDLAGLALPLSATRRRVSYRAGLNAYSVSESVQLGELRLLRPELVCLLTPASE